MQAFVRCLSLRVLPLAPFLALLQGCPLKQFDVEESPAIGGAGGVSGASGGGGGGPSAGGLGGISGATGASTPSLTNDRYVLRQGGELDISAAEGVLSNDAPVALRVVDFSTASSARPAEFEPVLEIHEDGGFYFKPAAGFFGVYRVTYTAENAANLRRNAELSIHVVPNAIELDAVTNGVGGFVLDGLPGDALGAAVALAGDVNADGRSDLVIGAPGYGGGEGAAYVVFGDERALPITLSPALPSQQGSRFASFVASSSEGLGASVAGPFDLDADGHADLLLGATGGNGRVYVVSGAAAEGTQQLPLADGLIFEGDSKTVDVGRSVSGAGDVNGDGVADLLLTSKDPRYGWLHVLFGPALNQRGTLPLASARGLRIRGSEPNDGFPLSAASVGDLDGDGFTEVFAASSRSFVLLRGGVSYPAEIGELRAPDAKGGWFLARQPSGRVMGAAVSGAGDVDGDGLRDLAYCDAVAYCRVIFSPIGSLATGWNLLGFSEGATRVSISGGGDVDGDALSDLLLFEENKAYVVHGRRAGHADVDLFELGSAGFTVDLPSGGSISSAAIVGDVNQDGISDFAIGDATFARGAGRVYVVFGVASQ